MSDAPKRLTVFLAALAAALPLAVESSLQVRTARGKEISTARPGGSGAGLCGPPSRSALAAVATPSPAPPTGGLWPPAQPTLSVPAGGQAVCDQQAARGASPVAGGYTPPRTRTLRMLVTGYCPCRKCCGRFSDGKTASGRSVRSHGSRFVAADTRILPFGTRLSVPGYHQGAPVEVLDRGARIKGMRLDVFFPSHAQAKRWGARWLDVEVYLPPNPTAAGLVAAGPRRQ